MILQSTVLIFFLLCSPIAPSAIFNRRGQFGNPSTYFQKGWSDYKIGFDLNGELWLGLDKLHSLTASGTWRLDVVMGDWDNSTYTARYNKFSVGSEAASYKLTVGSFDKGASTLGDSMSYHNGMKFFTKDVDTTKRRCSTSFGGSGGWWFRACFNANPNGLNSRNAGGWSGIYWWYGGSRGNSVASWKSSKFTITITAH